ncbi:MAG: DUF305 domain-containing protein [Thermoleophilaceae bacterium]
MRTTKNTSAVLTVLLIAALAALGVGCGSSDSSKSDSASGNPTDRAFVAEMVPHHRAGVEMADVATEEGTSRFVKTLAQSISSTQKAEIGQMERIDRRLAKGDVAKGKLGMSHAMKGMNMDAQALRGAKPFDARFISMMVPHHESAVEMAKIELDKGENPDLKKLARSIIATQKREVSQMRAHKPGSSSGQDMEGMHEGHSG